MLSGHNWELRVGDVREQLAAMDAGSVHCVVTSPPYWGLRAYGTNPQVWGGDAECEHSFEPTAQPKGNGDGMSFRRDKQAWVERGSLQPGFCRCGAWSGELGLEPTPELFIEHMVEVFRGVHRVLRNDGTCWLNLGDSYNSNSDMTRNDFKAAGGLRIQPRKQRGTVCLPDLKPKDLVGIPWRVALALQADGWYLRSAMPWVKRSAMPEPVTDRPASALEYVFLLTKKPRYYFDMEAVRRAPSGISGGACFGKVEKDGPGSRKVDADDNERLRSAGRAFRNTDLFYESLAVPHGMIFCDDEPVGIDVNPKPYKEAHFATFPPRLVEPMVKAGTSEKGCCPECGKPWERVVERSAMQIDRSNNHPAELRTRTSGTMVAPPTSTTTGWQPACDCYNCEIPWKDRATAPCRVLDPFAGSGTTLRVARQLGRYGIGIELSKDYAKLAEKRITKQDSPVRQPKSAEGQLSLL